MTELAAAAGWIVGADDVRDADGRLLASLPPGVDIDTALHALLLRHLRDARELLDEYAAVLKEGEPTPEERETRKWVRTTSTHAELLDRIRTRLDRIKRELGDHTPGFSIFTPYLVSEQWALELALRLVLAAADEVDAPLRVTAIPPERWSDIMRLVHPDVHPETRRELATAVTAWLSTQRAVR